MTTLMTMKTLGCLVALAVFVRSAGGMSFRTDLSVVVALRSASPGFAAVVVAPEPNERLTAGARAVQIELGRDIRVRNAATAPQDLASAIIKTLAAPTRSATPRTTSGQVLK